MVKITAALLIVFLIEVSLYFFGGGGYNSSVLFSFLMSPEGATATIFYGLFYTILFASAAATIVPGGFYQVNQWALFAVAALAMLTFVTSITHLWAFVNGQLIGLFSNSAMGGLIASLITAPLLIFYLVAVSEWTRQN